MLLTGNCSIVVTVVVAIMWWLPIAVSFQPPSSSFLSSTSSPTSSTTPLRSSASSASSFDQLGLSAELVNAIKSQPAWTVPTPIQTLAIPRLLSQQQEEQQQPNDDVVWCQAPTGSGKTAAALVPLIQNLRTHHHHGDADTATIRSLILVPTRELAVQVGRVARRLCDNTAPAGGSSSSSSSSSSSLSSSWNVQVIHGGVPLGPQLDALQRRSYGGSENNNHKTSNNNKSSNKNKTNNKQHHRTIDILIATPGRLTDVLEQIQNPTMERRLIEALDGQGKMDATLSLTQLEQLQSISSSSSSPSRPSTRKAKKQQNRQTTSQQNNLLDGIEYLILDEADRLLSKGFQEEMQHLPLPRNVPTWLFSATFPKHMESRVEGFIQRLHDEPNIVRLFCVDHHREIEENDDHDDDDDDAPSDSVSDDGTEPERVSPRRNKVLGTTTAVSLEQVGPAIDLQTVRLDRPHRTQALRRLLDNHATDWDRVLVFCATRYAAEHVAKKLRRGGISCAELHGKLDQDARLRRLEAFSNGKIRVLTATDVASRGLDVVGLPAVVNYDLPRSTADFLHRVGRVGRAGRRGTAVSFVTAETAAQYDLIEKRHLRETQQSVEFIVLKGLEPDEKMWKIKSAASTISIPGGNNHSIQGLAHDRMHGGIKGRRKSKKDRLREAAAKDAQQQQQQQEAEK